MFSHIIVFVTLSILSATAAYAAVTPMGKTPQEQCESGTDRRDTTNSL